MAARKTTEDSGARAKPAGARPAAAAGETAEAGAAQGFEKAMERLERIVSDMESGSLSLEDMITRFEEGQKLIQFCTARLNEVEKKVEVLVRKGEAVISEPLEDLGEDGGDPAPAGDDGGKDDLFR